MKVKKEKQRIGVTSDLWRWRQDWSMMMPEQWWVHHWYIGAGDVENNWGRGEESVRTRVKEKKDISSWGFVRLLSVELDGSRSQIRCLWKDHVVRNIQQLTELESGLFSRSYGCFFWQSNCRTSHEFVPSLNPEIQCVQRFCESISRWTRNS